MNENTPRGAEIVAGPGRSRMYGRGTQDMKSGLIANLYATRALMASGVRLRGDVILQSVIEEEAGGGGGGTLACFQRGHRADGFIASEPHWHDISIAHPGILYFRVVVEGKSAHAGRAHQGVNAALEAAPIVAMLGEWDRERAEWLHYEPFERLDPTARRSCHLNVGVVKAGGWPSTVPGRCEIEVRMSFVPGETEAEVRREVAARTRRWWSSSAGTPNRGSRTSANRSRRISPAASPILAGITAGLDTRFAGLHGVPALAWGPKGAGPHGADEYVELDSVIEVARTLAIFAVRWCG